jgi:hypothetical protein
MQQSVSDTSVPKEKKPKLDELLQYIRIKTLSPERVEHKKRRIAKKARYIKATALKRQLWLNFASGASLPLIPKVIGVLGGSFLFHRYAHLFGWIKFFFHPLGYVLMGTCALGGYCLLLTPFVRRHKKLIQEFKSHLHNTKWKRESCHGVSLRIPQRKIDKISVFAKESKMSVEFVIDKLGDRQFLVVIHKYSLDNKNERICQEERYLDYWKH